MIQVLGKMKIALDGNADSSTQELAQQVEDINTFKRCNELDHNFVQQIITKKEHSKKRLLARRKLIDEGRPICNEILNHYNKCNNITISKQDLEQYINGFKKRKRIFGAEVATSREKATRVLQRLGQHRPYPHYKDSFKASVMACMVVHKENCQKISTDKDNSGLMEICKDHISLTGGSSVEEETTPPTPTDAPSTDSTALPRTPSSDAEPTPTPEPVPPPTPRPPQCKPKTGNFGRCRRLC